MKQLCTILAPGGHQWLREMRIPPPLTMAMPVFCWCPTPPSTALTIRMYSDLASRSSRDVVVISPAATGGDKVKKETLQAKVRIVHKRALWFFLIQTDGPWQLLNKQEHSQPSLSLGWGAELPRMPLLKLSGGLSKWCWLKSGESLTLWVS